MRYAKKLLSPIPYRLQHCSQAQDTAATGFIDDVAWADTTEEMCIKLQEALRMGFQSCIHLRARQVPTHPLHQSNIQDRH
ncbi:hypothetical protein V1515DRAFT_612624 [Lipomyces mesembrius]